MSTLNQILTKLIPLFGYNLKMNNALNIHKAFKLSFLLYIIKCWTLFDLFIGN